jgi:hypothetical protein
MSVKVGLGVQATILLVNPTTATRKRRVFRHHRCLQHPHGGMVKMLVGIRCEYPQKPPDFTVSFTSLSFFLRAMSVCMYVLLLSPAFVSLCLQYLYEVLSSAALLTFI